MTYFSFFLTGIIAWCIGNEYLLVDEVFVEFLVVFITTSWLFDEWLQDWEIRALRKQRLIAGIFSSALVEWQEALK